MGGKNENGTVAFPERVPIHLKFTSKPACHKHEVETKSDLKHNCDI